MLLQAPLCHIIGTTDDVSHVVYLKFCLFIRLCMNTHTVASALQVYKTSNSIGENVSQVYYYFSIWFQLVI